MEATLGQSPWRETIWDFAPITEWLVSQRFGNDWSWAELWHFLHYESPFIKGGWLRCLVKAIISLGCALISGHSGVIRGPDAGSVALGDGLQTQADLISVIGGLWGKAPKRPPPDSWAAITSVSSERRLDPPAQMKRDSCHPRNLHTEVSCQVGSILFEHFFHLKTALRRKKTPPLGKKSVLYRPNIFSSIRVSLKDLGECTDEIRETLAKVT